MCLKIQLGGYDFNLLRGWNNGSVAKNFLLLFIIYMHYIIVDQDPNIERFGIVSLALSL